MSKDPGLFTDSTGDGMAGAEDVSLETQRQLRTNYSGENTCTKCGIIINPVQSLVNQSVCPSCSRKAKMTRLKGRMSQ